MDHWIPDWATLKPTIREDQATVVCSVKERTEPEAGWFDRDPKTVLRRIVDRAKGYGVDFTIGFEVEFLLLKSYDAEETISIPFTPFGAAVVREPAFDVVLEAVEALEAAGVGVWKYHAENRRGKFEIALGPNDPITAVDDVIYAHDIIKSVARRHNLHATMHPKPFEDGPTAGQHIHISLNKEELSDSFLAGLLDHFRGISAVLLGGYDSYDRTMFYAQGDICWARGRYAPIHRASDSHFEIRVPDALGNPYFQIASIIGAGLYGIQKGSKLEMKPKTLRSGGAMNEEMKREIGVTDQVPTNLSEAVEAMKQDAAALKEVFGEKCFDTLLWYRTTEIEKVAGMTRAERSKKIVEVI